MSRCKTGRFRDWEHENSQADLRKLARKAARTCDIPASLNADIERTRDRIAENKRALAEHDSSCEQCAGGTKS